MWDFSDSRMTFDNPGYTFDGTAPIPPPAPPVQQANIMPSLIGLEYPAALLGLQQLGIFVPASLGYFGTFPITIIWARSAQPPGTVLAQVPQPGTYVAANGPVTLTASEFPMGVAFP
jgi:beta-lactam-binding protein with PASTA domain